MMVKTWQERCEAHPDHDGVVSHHMIVARMQEEIDELREALLISTNELRLYSRWNISGDKQKSVIAQAVANEALLSTNVDKAGLIVDDT